MSNILEYAIKSGISLTVLYLFYWLVLRKDTHFWINRLILLFSVIISMVLPAITPNIIKTPAILENLPSLAIDFNTAVDPVITDLTATAAAATNTPADSPLNIWKIITTIYLIGALLVFARLIYQAIFLHAVSRLSKKVIHNGFTIVSMSTEMIPFSYFNRIFIPATRIYEGSLDSIIAHEKSHLSQWHYIDLFIIEIISIVQWFNPIIWLFEKSIKEVHEYLADEAVLNSGKNPGRYQALLVNQALGGPVFLLTNQFNQSLIKKRIMMMKSMKTSRAAQLKALLIIPLIAGLLLVFANAPMNSQSTSDGQKITITGNVTDRSTGKALSESAVIIKGTTTGTVTDARGRYQIIVNNTQDELVISKVGYRTQVIPVGNNTKFNVQLERDILSLDFSKSNMLDANEKHSETVTSDNSYDVFEVIEELPAYPGGTDALQKFLKANLQYPEDAKMNGIEGEVMVNYIIRADGMVTDAKILRGISSDIDKEALRLTNLIKGWKPASQNGHPIPMEVTMPIEFKIQ
jgi:TonB family protein